MRYGYRSYSFYHGHEAPASVNPSDVPLGALENAARHPDPVALVYGYFHSLHPAVGPGPDDEHENFHGPVIYGCRLAAVRSAIRQNRILGHPFKLHHEILGRPDEHQPGDYGFFLISDAAVAEFLGGTFWYVHLHFGLSAQFQNRKNPVSVYPQRIPANLTRFLHTAMDLIPRIRRDGLISSFRACYTIVTDTDTQDRPQFFPRLSGPASVPPVQVSLVLCLQAIFIDYCEDRQI